MVENLSTFAEMNSTTDENIIPIGSATTVNVIGVVEIINTHSSTQVDWYHTTFNIWGRPNNISAHTQNLAVENIFRGRLNIGLYKSNG